jgi:hypothetical protein
MVFGREIHAAIIIIGLSVALQTYMARKVGLLICIKNLLMQRKSRISIHKSQWRSDYDGKTFISMR